MFKKATFAFAGVLGMVAVAALSTTAGAADTDAALADNVKFYQNQNFNLPLGVGGTETAEAADCKTVALNNGVTEAKSAELLNQDPNTTLQVKLFSDEDCTATNLVATLSSTNPKDAGLTWGGASVKSYKVP